MKGQQHPRCFCLCVTIGEFNDDDDDRYNVDDDDDCDGDDDDDCNGDDDDDCNGDDDNDSDGNEDNDCDGDDGDTLCFICGCPYIYLIASLSDLSLYLRATSPIAVRPLLQRNG